MSGPLNAASPSPQGPERVRAARLLAAFHEEAPPAAKFDRELLARLLPYVRPHAPLFVGALALMPVAAVASLFFPLLVKRAIDAAVAHAPRSVLVEITGLFLVAVAVEFVARWPPSCIV